MSLRLRAAGAEDAALVAAMVRELADFEKMSDEAIASPSDFAAALAGDAPLARCEIAEVDGEPAGFALWFYTFSTFTGRAGIHLEDLFVRPAFRRRGIARAFVARLAERCVAEALPRLEWSVLDWNDQAIAFYEGLGAVAMDGWTVYRVKGEALRRLGVIGDGRAGRRAGDEDGRE